MSVSGRASIAWSAASAAATSRHCGRRGRRGGTTAAPGAAAAARAILPFDDKLRAPRDRADGPVMVQELPASHYTTIQMLEGAVGSEHIKTKTGGLPQMRYAALKD